MPSIMWQSAYGDRCRDGSSELSLDTKGSAFAYYHAFLCVRVDFSLSIINSGIFSQNFLLNTEGGNRLNHSTGVVSEGFRAWWSR